MQHIFEPFFQERQIETEVVMNKQVKKVRIIQRVDQFTGAQSNISEERARRPLLVLPTTIKYEEKCDFCFPYKFTPDNRIAHTSGVLSVCNLFPWEKGQWITILPPFNLPDEDRPILHKVHLSELTFDDMFALIDSSYDLAVEGQKQGAEAFFDFTNWGPYAGASRQHPHSQRTWISNIKDGIFSYIFAEMERAYKYYQQYKENLFDRYIREEEAIGVRKIFSNDAVYIGAPWAPRRPHEVIVISKIPFANIIQTTKEDRNKISKPILGIFHCMHYYLRITDFNLYVHMSPFVEVYEVPAEHYYRWHMHILPRKASLPVEIGGAELGTGQWIVDCFPEITAQQAIAWYTR